ncbi:caspase family protein [Mesorhizobium sp. L103C120A0]|uniref:caspase family protein n=1 Tax=Mesorhizobium sp. L103C120A0 TaxID=1287086 RepID=UPI0003CFC13E|nr:caspase family protein [Mesorhizobium sp. L103C120A0]ESZ62465.1 hypothetical protein X728_11510 [Mesorhizobium sp. L103C120A0]
MHDRQRRSGFLLAVLVLIGGLLSPAAGAAGINRALLIGVSDYPGLGPKKSLKGPANDVALLRDYLLGTPGLGFIRENIVVLANGVPAADGLPERQVILSAMDRLADEVKPDDFVYLHFSGHGSRQRVGIDTTEPDQRDEVFLPADTQPPKDGRYPNAVIDDEIGQHIDRIRRAGAFVFVVFDSCQSSSATRSGPGGSADEQERWLPEPVVDTNGSPSPEREQPIGSAEFGATTATSGGMAAFFAAQTVEPTPELQLPTRAPGMKTYGLFTYAIVDVLAKNPGITYRQLAEGVMHFYAVSNRQRPTPLFEGDLDRTVFGTVAQSRIQQWQIRVADDVATVAAGRLQGLERDAVLAVLPDPNAGTETAIGYLRVTQASTLNAELTPIEHAGLPAIDLAALGPGTFARPIEMPIEFESSIAFQPSAAPAFAAANETAKAEITKIVEDKSLPLNLNLVSPGEEGALRLLVASESELYPGTLTGTAPRLWFLGADGRISSDPRLKPHSIGLEGGIPDDRLSQIKSNIAAVFRATSLSRLTEASPLGGGAADVTFSVSGEGQRTLAPFNAPILKPGATIDIAVENLGARPVDVDVLLIGPDYSIRHMMGNRFQSMEKLPPTPIIGVAANSFGPRQVIVVAREVDPSSPQADLSFLEQVGVRTRAGDTQGAQGLDDLLGSLANAPPTRSALIYNARERPRAWVKSYSFQTLP